MDEVERIRHEYRRRAREVAADAYSLTRPENLFAAHQRARNGLAALSSEGFFPCAQKRILEVGCGAGGWLPLFELWGAMRGNLAGIDLDEARLARARRLLCADRDDRGELLAAGADLRLGDAAELPWPDGAFDLVLQSTVFSSVLDVAMRNAVAGEMLRVLKPGGIVLWYDFCFNNPSNPNVRGVGKREIASLYPGCIMRFRRLTLAPPIARWLVPRTWLGSLVLETLRLLNTHGLATIRKPES